MEFQNPYLRKDYRLVMAVPVALALLGLFLAFVQPGLERGIDLKGGLLVTLQAQEQVDEAGLKAELAAFSKTVDVRSVSTPTGTGVEIELENVPGLEQAEEDVKELIALDGELSRAELDASANNATQDSPAIAALREQVIAESTRLLQAIGSGAALPQDAHAAVEVVVGEQAAAKQTHRDEIIAAVKKHAPTESISFREVGSSLSKFFLQKTREILLLAFVLAAIVVFIVFRSLVPSFAVIFAAVADLSMTLGVMALMGIPLTLATIATLLMLIGFALDTNVMMTIRAIKRREGTAEERIFEAMHTGLLMNATTIGAFGALWAVSQWLQIPVYGQIGIVALIGGFADFIATWMFNAPLVLEYARKQEKRE